MVARGTPAGGLFAVPEKKGAGERVVERQVHDWRAGGRTVDPLASFVLRRQGRAIDWESEKRNSWGVTNAARALVEFACRFGLVEAGEGPDAFAQLIEAINDESESSVRHEPPA